MTASILLLMLVPVVANAAPSVSRARRVCPVVRSSARAGCFAWLATDRNGRVAVDPFVPSGYGPGQFHSAYGWPTTAPGKQTLAIVDAFDDPHVFSDLKAYDKQFGLPTFKRCSKMKKTSCLSVVNQDGHKSPLPAPSTSWGLEISLDVQVAHAVCQNCKLLLVEASSNDFTDLETAVDTAVGRGAKVVSNSYGNYGDDCSEPSYDHPKVAVVVASGDAGFGIACPADLSTVVSVAGTTLTLAGGGTYGSESVWSGTGSGCSAINAAQPWQSAVSSWSAIGCGAGRGMNDLAADGDPATGAAVYDTYGYGGWLRLGGTSLSAPLIAGGYALAANESSWAYPAKSVYDTPSALHDVTVGSNGSCAFSLQCHAGTGYDLPTGIGTPNGLGGL